MTKELFTIGGRYRYTGLRRCGGEIEVVSVSPETVIVKIGKREFEWGLANTLKDLESGRLKKVD